MKLDPTITITDANINDIIGKATGFITTTAAQLAQIKDALIKRTIAAFEREQDEARKVRIIKGLVHATDARSAVNIYHSELSKGNDTMPKSNDPILPKNMLATAFGDRYALAMDSMRAKPKPAADTFEASDSQKRVWAQAFGAEPMYAQAFEKSDQAKATDAMGEMMDMPMEKSWAQKYRDAYNRTRSGPDAGIDMNKSYQSGLSNVGGERGKGGIGQTKSSMDMSSEAKQARSMDRYRKMYEDAKGIKRKM